MGENKRVKNMAKKADTANKSRTHARMTERKKAVIEALQQSLGIVTTACKRAKVSRTQFYEWLKNDPVFAEAVADVEDIALDYVESKLFENIQHGDTQSIHYYLKCKGGKRGYGDKHEVKVELPQFNDNRTNAEIAGIFAERMKLYGEE